MICGAGAKTWTNNIGAGFSLPISQFGVDKSGADDIFQLGYGIEATYLGFHENGFTVKADVSGGLATSKDISIQDHSTNLGVFYNFAVGAGYSFVRTQKFTLSATAMLGLDAASYSNSEDDIQYDGKDCENVSRNLTYTMFSAGADLFASYKIKEHFGVFANISARYLVAGGTSQNVDWTWKDESGLKRKESAEGDGPDLKGKFRVQPTIGVVWNF